MPERRSLWAPGLAALLLAFALLGCGKQPEVVAKYPVKGKVLNASGGPVPQIVVIFHPKDAVGTASYPAPTEKDGAFSLECPQGAYKVVLLKPALKEGGGTGPGTGTVPGKGKGIPTKYNTPDNTPLLVDIPSGGKTDVVLTVR